MFAPRRTALGVSLVLSCLLAGCAVSPVTVSRALSQQDSPLSFSFTGESGGNYIDQVVEIDNDGDAAELPTLSFAALGPGGVALPDVKVSTAFGSDHGNLVVPPGGAWEVLEFLGAGSQDVTDVKVTVVKSQRTDYPPVESEPDADPIDYAGDVTQDSDDFTAVRVTNGNDDPLQVRVVYVVWELDDGTHPQQFKVVVPIGGVAAVPAHGEFHAPVDDTARGTVDRYRDQYPTGVLAYYSL